MYGKLGIKFIVIEKIPGQFLKMSRKSQPFLKSLLQILRKQVKLPLSLLQVLFVKFPNDFIVTVLN